MKWIKELFKEKKCLVCKQYPAIENYCLFCVQGIKPPFHDQPERSKREDSVINYDFDKMAEHAYKNCSTEMRCSEHCGNTVRDK